MSASVLISLRNQPPIWAQVLPASSPLTPYSLNSGSIACSPPPKCHHAVCWRALPPKQIAVENAKAGSLPK
ncbi:hypothetical protein D3C83_178320 [compost metagenome]